MYLYAIADNANIDRDFRPDTCWPQSLTREQLISRIKGQVRRTATARVLAEDGFGALSQFMARESLDEADRALWSRVDPLCMGGGYLPDLDDDSVEVARISLRSTTGDQISIRAQRIAARIRYFVVDEYDSVFGPAHVDAPGTLTPLELVNFIDSTIQAGDPLDGGLFWSGILRHFDWGLGIEESADFSSIKSCFYPQLADYYAEGLDQWMMQERYREAEEESNVAG